MALQNMKFITQPPVNVMLWTAILRHGKQLRHATHICKFCNSICFHCNVVLPQFLL